MTTQNAFATLAEYKGWVTVRSGDISIDAADDTTIEAILKGVSRYIERQSGRQFVPYVETRYFDTPTASEADDTRLLKMDTDLLEVLSVTNGDGTSVPSTEYLLLDSGLRRNSTPYRYIRIKDTSTYIWTLDSAGDYHSAVAVSGVWGQHDRYSTNAWLTGTTLAEALDASETDYDITSATLFARGNLTRIDNEINYVSGISGSTLTMAARGANGSTAAAHDNGSTVKIWQVQDDIKEACLQIAQNVYSMRSGQSSAGRISVTASGVVIRPEEIPPMAKALIDSYRRMT